MTGALSGSIPIDYGFRLKGFRKGNCGSPTSLVFLNCEERNIENQIYFCENEENKNFGRIRPDGVVIRSQWDVRVSYTFVEFEENAEKENQNLKMLKKLPKIKVLSWG
ncbi:hypothetical protein JHK85_052164 [Glycine max]|nr:hypothetical protein JHK85_052164 [Glycine max]